MMATTERVQDLRARMLRDLAGLVAAGLPAPMNIAMHDRGELYPDEPLVLALRMESGDRAAVDAWAAHLGAVAGLDSELVTGGQRWQPYRASVEPAPWRGWREAEVWCSVDLPQGGEQR